MDRLDRPILLGVDARLHFHRFDSDEQVAFLDRLTTADGHRRNHTRHWRAHMVRIAGLCLWSLRRCRCGFAVLNADRTGLTIEFEEHARFAFVIGLAHGDQADFKNFAGVNFR